MKAYRNFKYFSAIVEAEFNLAICFISHLKSAKAFFHPLLRHFDADDCVVLSHGCWEKEGLEIVKVVCSWPQCHG